MVKKVLKYIDAEEVRNRKINEVRKKRSSKDDDLIKTLEESQALIRVVGAGGGGGNTINRMSEVGIIGAETVAINTDAQDLLYTNADHKILIGKELTGG